VSADVAVPEVAIKLAQTAEERELVFRLRYETYVAEMNMFSPVADHAARRLTDAHDERSELLIAFADGEPVGTLRLTFGADGPFSSEFLDTYGIDAFLPVVPREAMLVLTRFIVRKAQRGTAIPFDLIAETARIAASRGVELAFCDCQPHLINLYGRLGFRAYRHTYNDPHMALMVPLVMIARDGDYLRQVGSPLLGMAIDPGQPTSELARRAVSVLPPRPPVRSLEHGQKYDWSSEIADALTGQALRVFENLDDSQLAEILAHSHIIDVASSDYLIREGQVTRTMYVLLGGELQYRAGPRHLANAQIGEVVGDVAFLLRTSRTIDVIAGPGGARVLSLNEPALRSVMESHSRAAAILLLNLCRMLAERVAARR
jgi:predicted GNAT family N-acyltransferase